MSMVRQVLVAVHVAIGIAVIALLCRKLGDRAQEVNTVRLAAHQERDATVVQQRDIAQMDELRKGLEKNDPYVIELLAREKLQYARSGEMVPPPAVVPKQPARDRESSDDAR